MRRCGDDDRFEFRHFEKVRVLFEGLGALALELFQIGRALLQVFTINVAQGHEVHAARLERGFGIHHAVPTAPDESHLQFLLVLGPLDYCRHLRDGQCASSGCLQKVSAGNCIHGSSMR